MRFHGTLSARILRWSAPTAFSITAAVVGCSSPDEPDGADGNLEPDQPYCEATTTCPPSIEGVDLTSPVVSFKNDVFPIFQRSCSHDTDCHSENPRHTYAADLNLGPQEGEPQLTDAEFANLVADLINETPTIGPADMKNVVPGDWQNSFLMVKVDGCQNSLGLDCPGTDEALEDYVKPGLLCTTVEACGIAMPVKGRDEPDLVYPMSDDDKNTIRRWIQQGALPN